MMVVATKLVIIKKCQGFKPIRRVFFKFQSELSQLVERELLFWKSKAKQTHNVSLDWDQAVLSALADGYNIYYGARSIKHEVERRVVAQLALAHETAQLTKGSEVRISVAGSENADLADADDGVAHKLRISIKKSEGDSFVDLNASMSVAEATSSTFV